MDLTERFSGTAYFGKKVEPIEALSIMHTILDPDYRGNAPEYVPGKGGFGALHVGTYGLKEIFFSETPPSLRYSNLSNEAKARLDKSMGNGRGR